MPTPPADTVRDRGTSTHLLDPLALGNHLDRLFRAAWALCGSREDAEDLVQETYVRLLARPRRIRADGDLGYLLRALRNTHISRRRSAGRRPQTVPLVDDLVADGAGAAPEGMPAANEVFAVIAALPEDFREALVAVDVLGLSYQEASRALGVREATIASRLHRARSRVAVSLSGPRRTTA